jgi:hypothetical protein
VRPPNEISYKRPQPRRLGATRSRRRARAHRPPVCPVIQIKTILTRYHAIHRHTRLQPVGERRRQAGSGQRTQRMKIPRYVHRARRVTLLRMRQVVDTTSLRPGPPAPPQCREWRRSLVSLPHEPPTSDLHASLAATHTHAQQPPISITRTRHSLGSVRCPPTRLPHGQRDAISSHSPHPTFAEPKRTWCALERASSHRASNDAVQGVAARTPPPMPSRAAIHPCVRCLLRLGEGSEARAEG